MCFYFLIVSVLCDLKRGLWYLFVFFIILFIIGSYSIYFNLEKKCLLKISKVCLFIYVNYLNRYMYWFI